MTQSTRTIAQISSSIDFVVKAINDIEANTQELRNAHPYDVWVVGFDYGFFLTAEGGLGGLLFARKFALHRAAELSRVRNGKGELSRVYTLRAALELSIRQNEHALDALRECLVDCQLELNEAYALERAADQAAWEDSFQTQLRADIERDYEDERRRKGSWSLRAAAARIADSSSEYEG